MDFARNERGFFVGFAWNLIHFSFVREREGYKHHADCTVSVEYHSFLSHLLIIHAPTYVMRVTNKNTMRSSVYNNNNNNKVFI